MFFFDYVSFEIKSSVFFMRDKFHNAQCTLYIDGSMNLSAFYLYVCFVIIHCKPIPSVCPKFSDRIIYWITINLLLWYAKWVRWVFVIFLWAYKIYYEIYFVENMDHGNYMYGIHFTLVWNPTQKEETREIVCACKHTHPS